MKEDLMLLATVEQAQLVGKMMDFEMFYSPDKDEILHAQALNKGKKLTDKPTKGYKYLKLLKENAWKNY